MKWKIRTIIGILLVIMFSYNNCNADEKKVLVLYDTYKSFASDYSNLNSIIKLIMFSSDVEIHIYKIPSNVENLNDFKKIVILNNEGFDGSESEFLKLSQYRGDILWFGNSYKDVARLSTSINMRANKISVFNLSLDSYKNKDTIVANLNDNIINKNYLILDKIYPFIDVKEFLNKVDYLNGEGIPFVCEVMPIYNNTNFQAMKRFCEALRYAQSKGGMVVMHVPIFYLKDSSREEVMKKTELALLNYIRYKVYPVAFSVPDSWIYKEDYKDVINMTNTIFVERAPQVNVLDINNLVINRYNAVIEKVDINETLSENKQVNSIGIAIDGDCSLSQLKDSINKLKKKGINISDINSLDTKVKLTENEISTDGKNMYLNNCLVPNKYFEFKSEENYNEVQ